MAPIPAHALQNYAASKIVIINSSALMRLGIATTLREAPRLADSQIMEFASVIQAGAALTDCGAGDLVLLDVTGWGAMERGDGPLLKLRAARVTVALMSTADPSTMRLLEVRGLSGIISPDCDPKTLAGAVGDLMAGRTCFKPGAQSDPPHGLGRLSHRQFEILELMTRGLLNKQIAWELGLTEGTVKSHVSAILEKLGCDRRTQAIATFMQSLGVGRNESMVA
jgi:DNA-binding NarL/FixJ family response regulator